ncbi:unnamed protein product [Diatraea saccharalis]|uniref:Sulfotransferase domain-containing protein n=1 Tax=Diatraea saccharalis TaxID=40085 RepID=A0A9N9QYH9_9NEOP|nr:unnamed protein product [Diatraea saccharalis]
MAPWLELPYDITKVTAEEDKIIKRCLTGYTRPFVKCGKAGYVMPSSFTKCAETIYNMKVRPDDVWVITFPRSGTTWTQELVWLAENDLDYETAKRIPLHERFPMLETTTQIPDIAFELIKMNFMNLSSFQGLGSAVRESSWETIDKAPSPRYIKTHLPLSLLPPSLLDTAKVVYVARDPRDVCVSYYFLHKMVVKNLFKIQFHHFWEAFRRDLLPWTPIVAHTNEAWVKRYHRNLHFVFYEDLIENLPNQIRRLCTFLGRKYSDEQIENLAHHLSFDSLRKNKKVNNTIGDDGVQFIRKGEAGNWKEHFDPKLELEAEEFLIERLRGLDLNYPSISLVENTYL